MSDQYTCAKFWRCALQVNPFSYNSAYRGANHGLNEEEYNQALLQKCLDFKISVVGLADHGSVSGIESLRKVLKPHDIVVFPGFEIAASDKTHFVCLFSEITTDQQLERYLGTLDLLDPSDGIRPSRLSSVQLIDKVNEIGGFIYAAHCTQQNGLLNNKLNHVWKHLGLRAVQIPGSIEDLKNVEHDFYRKVLLNKNEAYRRERRMAVINAKDVAQPEDLGEVGATCYIKMTQPTFSAFKMAFLDSESRIRLSSQMEKKFSSKILKITVFGGYLDGISIDFSENLNAIIGGRGVGKSTLLECIRYALDIQPKSRQATKIHNDILKENLGHETGRVELVLVSSAQNNHLYTVSRQYGAQPIVRDLSGKVSSLHPRDLLPSIDIYGQNEIYELAQDETRRLQLLDRFLPHNEEYERKNKDVRQRLVENQGTLMQVLSQFNDLKEKVDSLPKLEEQLKRCEELGLKEKLAKAELLAREKVIATRAQESMDSLQSSIDDFDKCLPNISFIDEENLKGMPDEVELTYLATTLVEIRKSFMGHLKSMKASWEKASDQFATQRQALQSTMQQHEEEITKTLRTLPSIEGKNGAAVGAAYQKIIGERERIKPLSQDLATCERQIKGLKQERQTLLTELSNIRSSHVCALQKAAKDLNRKLARKLNVEIKTDTNRLPLINFLIKCDLEGIKEKRLSWIESAETLTPVLLTQSIQNGVEDIQRDWGVTAMVAEALTKLQPSQLMELETLELGHQVNISLNVAHDGAPPEFRSLDKLSTGQQCTAILHMLLLENEDPLLMDQPEDNLDNAFIAERIVAELRDAKTRRQFLFATHNANIPVFGDAEWIGVFTASDNHARLARALQGSIDVPAIRDQVANILEGGRAAFIQRKEKYEF